MDHIIQELIACLRSWEPQVRVLGNVQAGPAADALEALQARVTKLREGILEAQKEGCACDFHLYAEDKDLLNDALLDVYLTQEQANREAKAEADRYRTALDRVWDALTAEDKRGAFTDTLWMPDNTNTTVFEFIDHTLNPE